MHGQEDRADQGQQEERDIEEVDEIPEGDRAKEQKDDNHEQVHHQGEDNPHHHQQRQQKEGGGDKSCNISMHKRMPGSKSQASQGGTTPIAKRLINQRRQRTKRLVHGLQEEQRRITRGKGN